MFIEINTADLRSEKNASVGGRSMNLESTLYGRNIKSAGGAAQFRTRLHVLSLVATKSHMKKKK